MAIGKLEVTVKENLYEAFKETAEAVGAVVCKVQGQKNVTPKIKEIVSQLKSSKIVAAPEALEDKLKLKEGLGSVAVHYKNILKEGMDAEIGICEADFAVVETGSIGLDCSDINVRLVTAMPPVHIAIINKDTIIEKFADSFKLVVKENRGQVGYFNYISGPSRTADIERVLTIGVHGPEQLFIIVVE